MSTNSFEDEEKSKLQELHNYDDTELRDKVLNVEENLNELNLAQQELVDDMSKIYIGMNITADTVEGIGRINKVYGKTMEEGTGEKNPTNPYKLKCVGNDVNLFDGQIESGNINSTGSNYDDNTMVRSKNFINVEPNENYIISNNGIAINVNVVQYDENHVFISKANVNATKLTTSPTTKFIKFVSVPLDKFKLQKGIVATPYSPYGFGTVENISKNSSNTSSNIAYVDKQLCGIDDLQDEIDYNKGKITRRCGRIVLDGTEGWYYEPNSEYFALSKTASAMNGKLNSNLKCSHYIFNTALLNYTVRTGNSYYIQIKDERYTTVEAWKAYLAKQYANGTPVTVIYELATPVIKNIDCSNKIVQYADETTVYNRDGAKIEVALTNNKAISEVNEDLQNIEKVLDNIKEEDFTNQITMTNSNYVFDGFLKKLDKMVVLQGRITKSFFSKNTLEVCMKIPAELAPDNTISSGVLLSDMGAMAQESNIYKKGIVSVNTSGNVSILNEDNGMKLAMICISWYVG